MTTLTLLLLLSQTAPAQPAASATPADEPAAEVEAAPTAESVLAAYVEATGGEQAHRQVEHRRHTGTIEVTGTPIELQGDVDLLMDFEGNRSRLVSNFTDVGEFVRIATGEVGWTRDPFSGTQLMSDDVREATLRELTNEALANPISLYDATEYVGTEESVGPVGERAHHLKLTLPSGRVVEQWFGVDSGLLLKQVDKIETPLGEATETAIYSDWRPAIASDGSFTVVTPFAITRSGGGGREVKLVFTEAEINGDVADDAFAVPADVAEEAGL